MSDDSKKAQNDELDRYRKKRDPRTTTEPFQPEPAHSAAATRRGRFVVHCHDARNRHYDLRIQVGGVLESFAVPRGPSLDPKQKRLAVQTEPHPLRYLTFEGIIPEGNYGAGPMIVWDTGRVSYVRQPAQAGLEEGALSLELDGFKLKGRFSLVRVKSDGRSDKPQWLLIKREDAYAKPDSDVINELPWSVMSGLPVDALPSSGQRYAELLEELDDRGADKGELRASSLTPMLCAHGPDSIGNQVDEAALKREGWLYELKVDGVRILAERKDHEARLFYRTHRPATASFPEIVEAMRTLLPERVILDGEIITMDAQGRPSFQKLSSRLHAHRAEEVRFLRDVIPVTYVVFDVLAVGDFDLRKRPLSERKEILGRILPAGGLIRTLDYLVDDGAPLMAFCDAHELEGVVGKRMSSPYEVGPERSGAWVKLKRMREDDFVVVGYTHGKGSRSRLGALELAAYTDGKLVRAGRVGSGLSGTFIDALLARLDGTEVEAFAAEGAIEPAPEGEVFVEPRTVVRVRYHGWTEDGRLRHPVFLGVRDDIDPNDARVTSKPEDATLALETATAAGTEDRKAGRVSLTNQSKMFWPDDGITKGDLCSYYESVADVLLPHLDERPVTLVRFPNGITGASFFQWRISAQAPAWLRSLELRSEERDGKDTHTILIDSTDALLYVANLGCIPLHVVASRANSLDICDFLTLDLDVEFASLQDAIPVALTLREILNEIGLSSYPKTSGKTGLHVLVPLGRGLPFDGAKQLLELVGRLALREHAGTATMERRKDQRGNRVFIDVGQTGPLRTIVAPYSVRAVPGAPVSTPLDWDEVSLSLDPSAFNIFTVPQRILDNGDPLADAWSHEIDFEQTLAKLSSLVQDA